MLLRLFFIPFFLFFPLAFASTTLPELTNKDVLNVSQEIMSAHAKYKELTPLLVKRTLTGFIEELDPAKTYFLKNDVLRWVEPQDLLVDAVLKNFQAGNFDEFVAIHTVMIGAIERRKQLEEDVKSQKLIEHPEPIEFDTLAWAESEDALRDRLVHIASLREQSLAKLDHEKQEKARQRVLKQRENHEEEVIGKDEASRLKWAFAVLLKAFAKSLDTHTVYFTPGEATQFMIDVQQRLFGIGVQLRDDLNGFSVVKLIEGGPADKAKALKEGDRIVAVNDEPVVGMGISEAVELIRGEKGTKVQLTLVRDNKETRAQETTKVDIVRDEVVITESRYETKSIPFGDASLAYIKLFSFYQDPTSSSAADISKELQRLKKEGKVAACVLDLRYNSGGLLTQAVAVAGLFMSQGIVVSIKDSTGEIQHLRDFSAQVDWDGPLVILISRMTASAAEIVAQSMQDYGRAIVVGDETSFGKGSFQTFTLDSSQPGQVNPDGEFKVTRGIYYTVSGNTPQLNGVKSDVVIPGPFSYEEIGERYAKHPLEADTIEASFVDTLDDLSPFQKKRLARWYGQNMQQRTRRYSRHSALLSQNSKKRLESNAAYKSFVEFLQSKDPEKSFEPYSVVDLQLEEALNVARDLVLLENAPAEKTH